MLGALIDWFRRRRRQLPWRAGDHRSDPYRVLVAEVMLQQTRVETVVPYYLGWLRRFPDLASLAAAGQDDVLHAWQGLGYYRRALRLRQAAREVVDRHGGDLPTTREALQALPGIGPYTAAAVAALAFGAPVVAVDSNVRRVAARLEGWQRPPPDAAIEARLLARFGGTAQGNVALTEALMELGALVCTARQPACATCPLATGCRAAASGAPGTFPAARRRPPVPRRRRWALVLLDRRGLWLRQRPPDELLPGLWGFPQSEQAPTAARCLPSVRHGYSHFRLELVPALVAERAALPHDAHHHGWGDLEQLALSAVDLRVLEGLRAEGLAPAVS